MTTTRGGHLREALEEWRAAGARLELAIEASRVALGPASDLSYAAKVLSGELADLGNVGVPTDEECEACLRQVFKECPHLAPPRFLAGDEAT